MTNRKYFFVMFFLLICSSVFAQVKVTVFKNDGAQQEFLISIQGSLSFDENNLVIFDESIVYSPINIPRSDISKLTFDEIISSTENIQNAASLQLFPNPAKSQFTVLGMEPESFNYAIFSLDGRKISSGMTDSGAPIDVSQLKGGVYFVKIGNYSLKLVKI